MIRVAVVGVDEEDVAAKVEMWLAKLGAGGAQVEFVKVFADAVVTGTSVYATDAGEVRRVSWSEVTAWDDERRGRWDDLRQAAAMAGYRADPVAFLSLVGDDVIRGYDLGGDDETVISEFSGGSVTYRRMSRGEYERLYGYETIHSLVSRAWSDLEMYATTDRGYPRFPHQGDFSPAGGLSLRRRCDGARIVAFARGRRRGVAHGAYRRVRRIVRGQRSARRGR